MPEFAFIFSLYIGMPKQQKPNNTKLYINIMKYRVSCVCPASLILMYKCLHTCMRCCSRILLYSNIRFTSYPIFFQKMVTMSKYHKLYICSMPFFVSFVVAAMHWGRANMYAVDFAVGRKLSILIWNSIEIKTFFCRQWHTVWFIDWKIVFG